MSTVVEWHASVTWRGEVAAIRERLLVGNKDVRVSQQPRPVLTDEADALVHVPSSTRCGSD